ncbi:MAG TPA: T9SS type A sorting domain-containing protein [Flavisolibacter sp.]|nr:T9SS type A sorting domain-containing protein [Flavisolibacter sp.]
MKKIYSALLFVFTLLSLNGYAVTYTFIGNGNYATPSNWQGGIRPHYDDINGDTIVIEGNCTLDVPFRYTNIGHIWVKPGGLLTLSGVFLSNNFENDSGTLRIDGIVNNNVSFRHMSPVVLTGTFNNYGAYFFYGSSLTLNSGSTFENFVGGRVISGTITVHPGSNFINSGTLDGTVVINGNGNIINRGVLAPGNSPGTATINGNYTATASAVHNFEVGGLAASSYDRLNVSGNVVLAGTLNIALINGFAPATGNPDLSIITGTISGTFSTVNLPSRYQLVYTANSVLLRYLATLPVTFTKVDVRKEGGAARILWQVQSQVNVVRYDIEKSDNGSVFHKIGEIASSQADTYSLPDYQPKNKTFYRIKAIDIDGSFRYSAVVNYQNGNSLLSLKLFPNPIQGEVTLQHTTSTSKSKISVYSLDGKVVMTVVPAVGVQSTNLDFTSLKKGAYVLSYKVGDGIEESIKLIK